MKKSLVERKIERQRIDEQNHRNVQLVMDRAGQLKSKEELDKWNFDLSSAVDNQIRFIFETNKDRLEYQTLINIEAETIEAKLIEENKEAADLDAIFNLGKSYISENNGKKDEGLRLCKLAAKRGLISPLIFLSNYYENIDKEQSLLYEHKAHDQVNLNKEYIELINNKCVLSADDFYQELKVLAAENCKNALHDIECRFIEITEQNKEQAFKWYTDLHEANYTSGTYKLAQMYSDGYAIDKCLSNRSVLIQPDGSVIETIDRIENIEEKRLLKNAIEKCFHRKNNISVFSYELIFSLIKWLEGKKNPSSLDLTALGQIYLYLSENEINKTENLNKSFLCFYKAGNSSQQFQLGQYYSALLSLDNSIHINDEEKIFINEWMESWIEKPLHKDGTRLDKSSFSTKITDKIIFFAHSFSLEIKNIHLEEAKKNLEEKSKELNNLIAMFAHNFLGTLQCIRSNAEYENNPNIHLKTVKMMGGALIAFSILSADDDKLVEQLKQDNVGETSLQQSLANNLALAISQLLGKTNKDKIINLYLQRLSKTKQIKIETTSEELRENKDYRKKWQALQHQWEDEFYALFSEKADLPELQQWITDNFFPIEIIGLDSCNISFKEYGITDSIFLIVFMEIFVNAFKYMDASKNEPLRLKLCEEDQCYKLVCENPSSQETGRGTHKGMDFLKTIAKKLKGHFITESTKSSFKVTFAIPSELLK
jgi:TPR repeat protein